MPSFAKELLDKELGNYSAVPNTDDTDSQASTLDTEQSRNWHRRGRHSAFLPWTLAVVFASTSIVLLAVLCSSHGSCQSQAQIEGSEWGTFGTGFKTDFEDARKHVGLVETTFEFGPDFFDNGTMYNPDRDVKRYSGDPKLYGDEIKKNWADIINYRYVRITEDEAYETFGDAYVDYWDDDLGAYSTGIEVFHTLHCVYFLWTAMYPEHFFHGRNKIPDAEVVHRDHCIEHVRQYIMCHADLSPTPTKFFEGLGRNYVLSNNPHVCRDFGKLRAWMTDRYKGPHEVRPYTKIDRPLVTE